jgi:hypothetical protein
MRIWVLVLIVVVAISALLFGFFGIRIVYSPELEIDWVATSAVATTIMAFLTYTVIRKTSESNRISERSVSEARDANEIAERAFEEMVYQREQTERPFVIIELDFSFDNETAFFIVKNHGSRFADGISVSFDNDFIDAVGADSKEGWQKRAEMFKATLQGFSNSKFHLAPQQSRKIYFAKIGSDVIGRTEDIHIGCSYEWVRSDGSKMQDCNETTMNLSDYHWVGEIWKNKGKQPINKIAKSLDSVNANMSKVGRKLDALLKE